MKKLFGFVFLIFFCNTVFAATKHSISGMITDHSTGESLIGSSVIVNELPGTGATTNAYGYYSLTLPEGKYTLLVSYIGYKTISVTVSFTENKQINFRLEPDSRQLNDVEIIAQRKNHNITSTEMGAEKIELFVGGIIKHLCPHTDTIELSIPA